MQFQKLIDTIHKRTNGLHLNRETLLAASLLMPMAVVGLSGCRSKPSKTNTPSMTINTGKQDQEKSFPFQPLSNESLAKDIASKKSKVTLGLKNLGKHLNDKNWDSKQYIEAIGINLNQISSTIVEDFFKTQIVKLKQDNSTPLKVKTRLLQLASGRTLGKGISSPSIVAQILATMTPDEFTKASAQDKNNFIECFGNIQEVLWDSQYRQLIKTYRPAFQGYIPTLITQSTYEDTGLVNNFPLQRILFLRDRELTSTLIDSIEEQKNTAHKTALSTFLLQQLVYRDNSGEGFSPNPSFIDREKKIGEMAYSLLETERKYQINKYTKSSPQSEKLSVDIEATTLLLSNSAKEKLASDFHASFESLGRNQSKEAIAKVIHSISFYAECFDYIDSNKKYQILRDSLRAITPYLKTQKSEEIDIYLSCLTDCGLIHEVGSILGKTFRNQDIKTRYPSVVYALQAHPEGRTILKNLGISVVTNVINPDSCSSSTELAQKPLDSKKLSNSIYATSVIHGYTHIFNEHPELIEVVLNKDGTNHDFSKLLAACDSGYRDKLIGLLVVQASHNNRIKDAVYDFASSIFEKKLPLYSHGMYELQNSSDIGYQLLSQQLVETGDQRCWNLLSPYYDQMSKRAQAGLLQTCSKDKDQWFKPRFLPYLQSLTKEDPTPNEAMCRRLLTITDLEFLQTAQPYLNTLLASNQLQQNVAMMLIQSPLYSKQTPVFSESPYLIHMLATKKQMELSLFSLEMTSHDSLLIDFAKKGNLHALKFLGRILTDRPSIPEGEFRSITEDLTSLWNNPKSRLECINLCEQAVASLGMGDLSQQYSKALHEISDARWQRPFRYSASDLILSRLRSPQKGLLNGARIISPHEKSTGGVAFDDVPENFHAFNQRINLRAHEASRIPEIIAAIKESSTFLGSKLGFLELGAHGTVDSMIFGEYNIPNSKLTLETIPQFARAIAPYLEQNVLIYLHSCSVHKGGEAVSGYKNSNNITNTLKRELARFGINATVQGFRGNFNSRSTLYPSSPQRGEVYMRPESFL